MTCDLDSIPSGEQATVTIVVTATRRGTLTNTASVTANESDPIIANNTDTETTSVR